ncbi:ribonuclease P protein subunit p14 [Cylas formicarius]|uniref:ribonuclease P protein subunit p14 n=1 Tax=Cylas formicarius TaxID=197179 RepID=UPI002958DD14|nr:ribonuclease P protein subunit p14 [Cylas formicarius]
MRVNQSPSWVQFSGRKSARALQTSNAEWQSRDNLYFILGWLDCAITYNSVFRILRDHQEEVTPAFFKQNLIEALKQLFGEVGAAISIDILKYFPEKLRAYIRVPKSHYIKLRSSLVLCGTYQNRRSTYVIHKASPLLLTLQGDSRDYSH